MSQQTGNQNQNTGGAPQPPTDHGQRIASIVRDSLQSGDLSRLSNLGPAVQDAVSDGVNAIGSSISNITLETRNDNQTPATRPQQAPQAPPPPQPGPAPGYQRARPAGTHTYFGGGSSGSRRPTVTPLQKVRLSSKGVVRMVFGILGMVVFGLGVIGFGIMSAAISTTPFLYLAQGFGFGLAGSVILSSFGFEAHKLGKRAQQYYELFEKKQVLTLEEMTGYTGRSPKKIKKDIKKMKEKGWLQDLYFDADKTCLMRGENTFQQYMESRDHNVRLQREEAERQERLQNPETADLEAFRSEGVATIQKIRAANEAIPGEEISEKLSRLEGSCARIFSYVAEHPEKLPDTRKFMDYYLPTTLKLVEKYREYEEMDYQPDNVKEAKRQIASTLDTIDVAYKNLLASFYQPDTLDISTDIVVLQNMLEQEGLTGQTFDIGGEGGVPVPGEITLTMDEKQAEKQ